MKALVSYIILSYNQERFICEALKGAASQDYDNLEIIVSDDCSADNTFHLIKEFVDKYDGPHRFILNQNCRNLGLVANLNKAFSLCHGEFIVNAAGDDISFPERCRISYEAIHNSGVTSISFAYIRIDGDGNVRDKRIDKEDEGYDISIYSLDDYLNDKYISGGCARVISRRIIDEFGYINEDCPTEDTTFNLRAFLLGGIAKSERPLVYYRIHGNNVSKGANYYEYVKPQLIYDQYLRDSQTALNKGFISEETYNRVKIKIDYYLHRENALQTMYHRHGVVQRLYFLVQSLFSSKFDSALKKILIRRFLSWTKNGY